MAKRIKAGRPKDAKASDPQSILDKANWELAKFDAKVANNMGKILEQYYDLAFTAEKENTRLAVLKELIKMQKDAAEAAKQVEDLERDIPSTDSDEEEEEDHDLDNVLDINFKQG